MTIRSRNPEDNVVLVEVWLRSVRATHTFLREHDIEDLYPQVRDQYLPAVEVSVYETVDGLIVGFIGVHEASRDAVCRSQSLWLWRWHEPARSRETATPESDCRRQRTKSAGSRVLSPLRIQGYRTLADGFGRQTVSAPAYGLTGVRCLPMRLRWHDQAKSNRRLRPHLLNSVLQHVHFLPSRSPQLP
jgi:hypothetical protein